jgi:flagellar basal-body rod modification protein FlgD
MDMSSMNTLSEPVSGTLIRKGESADPGMGEMGQEQFLTLMLAQLKNQDPLQPLEPGEFLGQLAQFSTVIGVQGMQTQMFGMVEALRASQTLEGASLIGRSVLTDGQQATFDGTTPVQGTVTVPETASAVELVIRNEFGVEVSRLLMGPGAGEREYTWNGRLADGEQAAAGRYEVSALARFADRTQALPVSVLSTVRSITVDAQGGGLLLNTENGTLTLSSVRHVM